MFHVLRNCNDQKRVPAISQFSKLVHSLKPFLHLGGAFRWATLLILSPLAAQLTDLQIIQLQMGDIIHMEKYITNFVYPSEVFHVLQGLLLLPENRMMLNASGITQRFLHIHHSETDPSKNEIAKVFCCLTLNKQETDTTCSELSPTKSDDVHNELIKKLLSSLFQYKSTMPSGEGVHDIALTAELLLKQFREELEKGGVDIHKARLLVTVLASCTIDIFPGKVYVLSLHPWQRFS